jgi:hypothetical protein
MCLGNSAGGRDNTAPVGGFCQQNGASNTYKFCPMAVGVRAPTQMYYYTPPPNATFDNPDSFGFQIVPVGRCTPSFSYTKLLRVGVAPPPPSAPPPPKRCGVRDIQAVAPATAALMNMHFLGNGLTAYAVDLNVSYLIPPDSRRVVCCALGCAWRCMQLTRSTCSCGARVRSPAMC